MSQFDRTAQNAYNYNFTPNYETIQRPTTRVEDFFGKRDSGFGLLRGAEEGIKYYVNNKGEVLWRGMSGILQFFHRWPLGFIKNSWARSVNQVIWNVILFIIIPGAIYSALIRNNAINVPEEIQKQTPDPFKQGLYFATVTMTTLGFGDITPKTIGAQIAVMFHILFFFIFNFIWTLDFDLSE